MTVKNFMPIVMRCVCVALSIIAIYSASAVAGENEICTSTPETCKPGTSIIFNNSRLVGFQLAEQIAKVCDFNKSIVMTEEAKTKIVVCVRK